MLWYDVVLVGLLALVASWYLSFSATRLDRMHARVEGARAALDAQLVRRASVSLQLATSGRLEPATALLLADAAHNAREASDPEREVAESVLTRALVAAFQDRVVVDDVRADPGGGELLRELTAAGQRVQLARRFLGDAVSGTRVVRRKGVVRVARLAGHAPWPQTFEMDDAMPDTLVGDPASPTTGAPTTGMAAP